MEVRGEMISNTIFLSLGTKKGYQVQVETGKEETSKVMQSTTNRGFPGGAVVKNLPANAGDTGSSPGPGRSHMPWSN